MKVMFSTTCMYYAETLQSHFTYLSEEKNSKIYLRTTHIRYDKPAVINEGLFFFKARCFTYYLKLSISLFLAVLGLCSSVWAFH